MADETKKIILETEIDVDSSVESINKLTAANKELRKERNALNLTTVEGQKRANEINTTIDNNTKKIKANVSAIEQQKINIGNYKSALDGVHPALGRLGQGLEAGAKGFKAMTLQALAFLATPIGAAIGAIVGVFLLLKSAISSNNEIFEKFENITNAAGIIIEVLVNRVGKLGEALIALASGNFGEAVDLTKEAFSGLADEIKRSVGEGQRILDMTRDLEDATRQLRIEQAKQENVIKSLVVASKNRNLSFDQQEDRLKKALSLEQKLVKTREELAAKALEIAVDDLANTEHINKLKAESYEDFAQRLVKNKTLTDPQIDPIVDAIVALEEARGSSLAFQEKVENSLAAVQEKRAAALEKQNAALAEQQALNEATRRAANQVDISTDDPLVGAFETQAKIRIDINKRMHDDLAKQNAEFAKEERIRAEKGAQLVVDVERQKFQTISQITGQLAGVFEEESVAYKGLASANALVNTYLAATAAYASGAKVNVFLGAIAAGAAIVAGLANVAKINGVEFAEGGWTGPGHKMKPVGIVHADEYVTPKRVRHMPAAQPHLMALERMRLKGYSDGGLATSSISQPINQQLELLNIVKNMPPVIASWSEGRKVGKRIEFKEKISKL